MTQAQATRQDLRGTPNGPARTLGKGPGKDEKATPQGVGPADDGDKTAAPEARASVRKNRVCVSRVLLRVAHD